MTFQLPCQIIRQLITKEPTHNPERLVKTLYQINQINQINSKKFKFQNEKADLQLELKKFLHTKPKNIYENTLNIKNFKNISNLIQNETKKNYGSWQNGSNLNLPKFKTVKNIPATSKKSNPKVGRRNSTKFQSHGNVVNGTISQMFSKPKTQSPSTQVFRRYSTLSKQSRKFQTHLKKPLLRKGLNPRILATPRFLTSLKTLHFHKNYSTKSKFFKFPYNVKRRSGVLDKAKMPPSSKLVDLRSDFFRRFSTRPRMFKFLIPNQKGQRKPRSTSVMLPKIPKKPFPTLKRLKKIYAAEKKQSVNHLVENPEPLIRADDNLKPKVKKLPKFKPSFMGSVKVVPAEVPKEQLKDWKIPQPKKRFDETTLETPKEPVEEELPVCRLDEIAGFTVYERKKLPSLLTTKKRKVTIFIDKIIAKCRGNGMEPRLDDLYWVPKMKKLPSLLHTSFRNYSTLRSANNRNVSTLRNVRHCTTCKSDESQNPCYPRVVVQKWPTRVKKGCLKRIDPVIWEKMPPYPFHKAKDCYNPHEKWLNECFKVHWKYLQPHRQKREAGPIINFKYPVYGFLRYQSDQSPRTISGDPIPKTKGLPMLKRLQGCDCNNKVFPCPREARPEPKRVEPPYPSFSECKGDDYIKPLSECHEYVIEKAPTPWPEPPKICPADPAFDGPRPPCGHYIRPIKDELQDTKKLEAHPSPCGENIARGSDVHTNAKRYYSTASNDISLRDYITRIRNLLSKPTAFKNMTDNYPSWGILKTNSAKSPEKPAEVVEDSKTDTDDLKPLSVEPLLERNESFIVATAPSMQKRNFSKTQLVEKVETQKAPNFPVDFSNPYELGKENCQNYLNQNQTEIKFSSGAFEEKSDHKESHSKELEMGHEWVDISLEPKKGETSLGELRSRELPEGFLNQSVAEDGLKGFQENKFVETGTNHASSIFKEPLRSTEAFPEGFSKYGLRAKMRYLMNLENNSLQDSKVVRRRSLELLRPSKDSKSFRMSSQWIFQANENGLDASKEPILIEQNTMEKNKDVPGLSKYAAITTPTKTDLPESYSNQNSNSFAKYEPNEVLMGSRLEYLVSGPKVAKIRSFLEERFKSLVEPKPVPKIPLEGKNQKQGTINHQTPDPILISPAKCDKQNVSTDLDKKPAVEESSKSEVPKRFPNGFELDVIRENRNPTHHPLEIKVEGFGNEEELKIGPKLSPVVIKKTSLTDPLKSGEFMQYLKAEKNPESKEAIQSLKESYSKGPIHLKNISAKSFMGSKDSNEQRSTLMEPAQLLKVEGGNVCCPIDCLKKNYSEGPIHLKDISRKTHQSVPDVGKVNRSAVMDSEEPGGLTIQTCSKVNEKIPENSLLEEEVKISVVESPKEISIEKYEQIGDSKRCSELSTNVFLSGNSKEPNFADLFTKASLCRVQRRNISTIRRQCHQSKPSKFKCSPKYYISTLDQTCDEVEVLKPKSPSISPNRTKKRKCCFPEVSLRDENRCACPKLNCKQKEDPCSKFKKCTWKSKKRSSVCNFCKPKSPCSNIQVKTCPKVPAPPGCPPLSLFERIKNYFKARPGCPTPEEARQKELLQKAEAAAEAAGMRLCAKRKDPCGEPEDKCCRKYSTLRRSSGFFQKNDIFPGVQSTDGKTPLTKLVPNTVPDSRVRVQRNQHFSTYQDPLTKSVPTYVALSPKYSTFQKRSNLGENRENAQEIGSLTKTTTRILPVAAPKYIGKMYQVKLSKIGVRNKLTTKQIEEEPYTYCQICRIVPRNGTHLP